MHLFVFSTAKEGRDAEYNEWYDTVHLPDVLGLPGVRSGTRYRVQARPDEVPAHRYLAVYELDGDGKDVLREIGRRSASGEFKQTDSLDQSSVTITLWEPI
jgi:hypothetical protein